LVLGAVEGFRVQLRGVRYERRLQHAPRGEARHLARRRRRPTHWALAALAPERLVAGAGPFRARGGGGDSGPPPAPVPPSVAARSAGRDVGIARRSALQERQVDRLHAEGHTD